MAAHPVRAAAHGRERLRPAGRAAGAPRHRRRRAGVGGHRARVADPRDDRDRVHRRRPLGDREPARVEGRRRAARDRRLRNGVLVAHVSAELPDRRREGRPVVRGRARRASAGPGHRERGRGARPHAGPHDHRGGCRDRAPARAAARAGVRSRAGLPLRPSAAARRDHQPHPHRAGLVTLAGVQALDGVKVVDLATVLAGPGLARHLADFGAEVVKVERPEGDTTRGMGWRDPRDDETLMWKIVGRGKRTVVLDLKTPDGVEAMLALCDWADVAVENMRPGTMERLGLGPGVLHARNPGLVLVRVTGFGQEGPYARRPGFATIAEAMSGLAGLSGEPDGAPLLPPIALTDEITALAGAFAAMVALRHRDRTGEGQVVDVSLLDTMLQMMGPLPAAYAALGYVQPRLGSGIPYSTPRGTYRCSDGVWVAVSASSESVARRVLELFGIADDPRFATFADRMTHRDALEQAAAAWIGGRPSADVLAAFESAQAAIAPVYSMADVVADRHLEERGSLVEVDGVLMQGPAARLSRTPAHIRHAGRPVGSDTEAVLRELGLAPPEREPPRGGSE
ncbi:MAG: CoA transferase [Actinobacteria bacterium]|nr:CoA transferase [Actinomycetota bacterium]